MDQLLQLKDFYGVYVRQSFLPINVASKRLKQVRQYLIKAQVINNLFFLESVFLHHLVCDPTRLNQNQAQIIQNEYVTINSVLQSISNISAPLIVKELNLKQQQTEFQNSFCLSFHKYVGIMLKYFSWIWVELHLINNQAIPRSDIFYFH